VKFFQFLHGQTSFSYDEYCSAHKEFVSFLTKNNETVPSFATMADVFLQFLFDLNILCYMVDTTDEPFYGWCFRERTPTNLAPKVRTHARYTIHFGLRKALELGRKVYRK
jgi:hypothetical protein